MLRVSEDGNRRRDGSSTANYRQLHQSLLHLQESADRIFDTISDRTAKERGKLMDLSVRIRNVKGKIDAISGSKKSVTVRSCARYLSNVNVEDFHSLFGYHDGATGVGFPVAQLSLNGALNREFGDDGTLDLYKFFSETTCEFLPMEVCLEKGDLSKRAAFAKNIAETSKFSNSSFLMEDHIAMDSLPDPKIQALPPPPPSLLLHNMNLMSKIWPLIKHLIALSNEGQSNLNRTHGSGKRSVMQNGACHKWSRPKIRKGNDQEHIA